MLRRFFFLTALATSLCAQTGSMLVSADGRGDFRTIQDAVDHAPGTGETIRIAPGVYREKLHVAKANIHLIGLGDSPAGVVLTFGDSSKTAGGTSKSASVTVDADGFMAENLTFENTWQKEHPDDRSQAVALLVSSNWAVFDRVRFLGAQDTLYANSRTCRQETTADCQASREFFHDCYITGDVDYIFGDAKALFENCELHSQVHSMVTITAQSRHYLAEDSGYYFLRCRITGPNGVSKVYFGRPWRDYSTVMFFGTDVEQKMESDAWLEWDGRLKTSTYQEYLSHGPGRSMDTATPDVTPELTPKVLEAPDGWAPEAEIAKLRALVR